ncbi:MAG: RNA polymerase sigma factor [Betaproteobacteria bacterium]
MTASGEMTRVGFEDREAARQVAFARLANTHLDSAYRLATFILAGDHAEAEDAVQDAALRAWEHFDDLRDVTRFEAWFTRIVVNACRDRIGARRLRLIGTTDGEGGVAPDQVGQLVDADALTRALLTLSPEHRVVVALRYLGDHSIAEIGARTGERTGTVRSRLHYALRALRAAIDAEMREVSR